MIATKYKAALLSLAAAGLLSAPAQAATVTGATDLSVTMPEILVLYHFNEIEINLTGDAASSVPQTGALQVSAALGTDISTEADTLGAAGETNPLASNNNMTVNIEGAWAVRSLSSSAVNISGSIENDTLTNGGATIGVTGLSLTSGTNSGASVPVTAGWSLTTGDMAFSLDLSNATAAGDYVSDGVTDTFLLTLSSD